MILLAEIKKVLSFIMGPSKDIFEAIRPIEPVHEISSYFLHFISITEDNHHRTSRKTFNQFGRINSI